MSKAGKSGGQSIIDKGATLVKDGTVTDLEAAKMLLDAWKFRQAHAWSSLTRYFLAAVLISVAPYGLDKSMINKLSYAVFGLSIIGGLLALAAVWLYAAEYVRAQTMSHGFRHILGAYGYYNPPNFFSPKSIVLKPKIGWSTVYVLAIATLVLWGINMKIVWSLIKNF